VVSGREPVEEERATAQDKGWRNPGAWQSCPMARGMRPSEQLAARMGQLLQPRHTSGGTGSNRRPRPHQGPAVPDQASQGAYAGHEPLPSGSGIWVARGSQTISGKPWRNTVGLGVKPVGKPDAGNRHVRFDERGGETDRQAAPCLSSTLPAPVLVGRSPNAGTRCRGAVPPSSGGPEQEAPASP
jgi:hypothetical protein